MTDSFVGGDIIVDPPKTLPDGKEIEYRIPTWGKFEEKELWTWDKALRFLDTHPKEIIDHHKEKMRFFLKSSHKRPSSPEFAKYIATAMEGIFHKNPITNICFFGFGRDCDSYPWHKDKMDVFLVQVLGEIKIRVEGTSFEDTPRAFVPGDCVWIPRGMHHQIITENSRVTFSFGVENDPDPSTYIAET